MVHEYHIIKVVLLAKIAPRMRQDFCLLVVSSISLLDVKFQGLNVVELLLSNKN